VDPAWIPPPNFQIKKKELYLLGYEVVHSGVTPQVIKLFISHIIIIIIIIIIISLEDTFSFV
jgi:hypothetical protein